MARSPSPFSSATVTGPHRHRQNSISPHQQQPSKRDKRRNMIFDKLQEMTAKFAADRDVHYRTELLGIQVGMSLVTEADAHGDLKLPADPEEVEELASNAYGRMMKGPVGSAPHRAGKIYSEFANQINYAMEQKDAELARLKFQYSRNKDFIRAEHDYSSKLAENEHDALASTTRDRLINSVTMRKNRVLKEKDVTDFGDGNAILLHPSQFGAANPTSPGGMYSKRSTRLRRDAEELSGFPDSNKRKRKAGESDDSPAPHRQRLENGTSTPVWLQEKARNTLTQHLSPLYSIDKLFTEKELHMVHHQAALAAHAYMVRHPLSSANDGKSANGDNGSSPEHGLDAEGNEDIKSGERQDKDDRNRESSPSPAPVSMERTFSHATRSTKIPNPNSHWSTSNLFNPTILPHMTPPGLNYPSSMSDLPQPAPRIPPPTASVATKSYVKGDLANQPMGLLPEEAASEYEIVKRGLRYNELHGPGKNLEVTGGGGDILVESVRDRKVNRAMDQALNASKVRDEILPSSETAMARDLRERLEGMVGKQAGSLRRAAASDTGHATERATPMSRQATNEGTTGTRPRRTRN